MQKKKYYGPYTIHVDDDNQVTRVELKQRGAKRWQLLDGEIARLRVYVMDRAAEFGYPVVEV